MRSKVVKTRDAFGQPVYTEMWDLDAIVAVGISIAKEDPLNKRANEFANWIKELGHNPTTDEFMGWVKNNGGSFVEMPPSEKWEN